MGYGGGDGFPLPEGGDGGGVDVEEDAGELAA